MDCNGLTGEFLLRCQESAIEWEQTQMFTVLGFLAIAIIVVGAVLWKVFS